MMTVVTSNIPAKINIGECFKLKNILVSFVGIGILSATYIAIIDYSKIYTVQILSIINLEIII